MENHCGVGSEGSGRSSGVGWAGFGRTVAAPTFRHGHRSREIKTRQIGTIQVLGGSPRPARRRSGADLPRRSPGTVETGTAIWVVSLGRRGRARRKPARSHCQPLISRPGCSAVGRPPFPVVTSPALQRHQLLGALAALVLVRDLRFQQQFSRPGATPGGRSGGAGLGRSPAAGSTFTVSPLSALRSPAAAGELGRWGNACFVIARNGRPQSACSGRGSLQLILALPAACRSSASLIQSSARSAPPER